MRFDGAFSRAGFSTICVSENSLPSLPTRSPTPTTPYMCTRSAGTSSTAMMLAFSPRPLRRVDHLREAAAIVLHQHVGQQQRKRLVADQLARAPHRVAQAQRQLLAREARRARPRQVARQRLEVGAPLRVR